MRGLRLGEAVVTTAGVRVVRMARLRERSRPPSELLDVGYVVRASRGPPASSGRPVA